MFGHNFSLRCPGWLAPAPGRNNSVGALASAGRGRGRGRGRPVEQPEGDDQPKVVQSPPRRLSKLLKMYSDADLEAQQEEVLSYKAEREEAAAAISSTARDGRPRIRASKAKEFVKGSIEAAQKRAKMFIFNSERNKDEANLGVYGKGKSCWWALRVNPGREKQVADAIHRLLEYQPPLQIDCKEVDIPREAECWVPSKKVRAWNPKTGKMGNKALKYDDGGFMLVKTIMDKAFVTMMAGNINVLGFQDREIYEDVEFPRPASNELLKTIRDWEADLSDVTEEQVKAQLGLTTDVLPATSEPSLEEFFYDEDVEASLAAVEKREARRADRGGGRGTRGGRFGERDERKRGRFGASTRGGRGRGRGRGCGGRTNEYSSSDYNNRYSSDARDSTTRRPGDGWDRPARRQQQQRDDFVGGSGMNDGGDWYEGGSNTKNTPGTSTGFENDATDDISGWFTGSTANASDDDIGWFGADTTAPIEKVNTSTRDMDARNVVSGDDSPGSAAMDDLDAIWGAGMGGGESDGVGSGWMGMDSSNDDVDNRNNNTYRERITASRGRGGRDGERGGRGGGRGRYGEYDQQYRNGDRDRNSDRGGDRTRDRGDRFERGGRGGRGGSFDEGGGRGGNFSRGSSSSSREYNDSRNDYSRDTRFSDADDLSWWDAPGETSGTASASTSAAVEKATTTESSTSSSPPSSYAGYDSSKAAPKEKGNTWNDGDDWFSDDADFSTRSKSSRNVSSGGDEAAASPLSAGTKVEVVSGRFQDFEGVIVESQGERVKAELDVFGTSTVVEISRGEVEPFQS